MEDPVHLLPPLWGLVLAGGQSSRMGTDKAWLKYGDMPQWQAVHALLSRVCEQVYVSIRPDQQQPQGVGTIPDLIQSGPAGGVVSAIQYRPDVAWLVAAVDMPLLSEAAVQYLAGRRKQGVVATAFAASDGLPEPLLTVFEPSGFSSLLDFYNRNHLSLRKFLLNAEVQILSPVVPGELASADTPDQYRQITGTN